MPEASRMPLYRLYLLKADGHVLGPPKVVQSPDDRDATEKARQILEGRTIEVWDRSRFVARLSADQKLSQV
jgi:hypothetical protein